MGHKSLPVLSDTGATLLTLSPTTIKHQRTKTVQIVGICNEPQEFPVSEHIHFGLCPLRDTHPFLLWSPTPTIYHAEMSEKHHDKIFFSQKGEINPELDVSHQRSQSGKLNDALTSIVCCVLEKTRADSGNTDHLSLLNQLPPYFWAKLPTGIDKFTAYIQSRLK